MQRHNPKQDKNTGQELNQGKLPSRPTPTEEDLKCYLEGKSRPSVSLPEFREHAIRELCSAFGVTPRDLRNKEVFFQEGLISLQLDFTDPTTVKKIGANGEVQGDAAELRDFSAIYLVADLPKKLLPLPGLSVSYTAYLDGRSAIEVVLKSKDGFINRTHLFSERDFTLICSLEPGFLKKERKQIERDLRASFLGGRVELYDNGFDRKKTSGNMVIDGSTPRSLIDVLQKIEKLDCFTHIELWPQPIGPFPQRMRPAVKLGEGIETFVPDEAREILPILEAQGFYKSTPTSLPPPLGFGVPVILRIHPDMTPPLRSEMEQALEGRGFAKHSVVDLLPCLPQERKEYENIEDPVERAAIRMYNNIIDAFETADEPFYRATVGIIGFVDGREEKALGEIPGVLSVDRYLPIDT
jgi:hypothetical protein